ncbi:MAG: riboflavin synthase [Candidatus Gastranaerophilales bacterium]|nr:riboflavin synthase [Candidatus Gastranaerophilales bacterium]
MFTGIIEEAGIIQSITGNNIVVKCSTVLEDTKCGDSIAVNGVCLTVTKLEQGCFTADISPETSKVTTLSELRAGDYVNLERALKLSDRLGGHIVSGHIDTTGKLAALKKINGFFELTFNFNKQYRKYTANKGSIALNGISLTIAQSGDDFVTIAIIPHTYDMTALKHLKIGDNVNIEFDILAKYVEKNLLSTDNSSITVNFLERNGFV